ncbi:hypothetical protein [Methylobacterium nigriterrae]|uniref:hypothetical protein n=1 Tax=Methylobacterium nigriterrae TaxID=3127512 RepID=UPI003013C7A7
MKSAQDSWLILAHQAAMAHEIDDHDGRQIPSRGHSAWTGALNRHGSPPASLLLRLYRMQLSQGSISENASTGAVEHSVLTDGRSF